MERSPEQLSVVSPEQGEGQVLSRCPECGHELDLAPPEAVSDMVQALGSVGVGEMTGPSRFRAKVSSGGKRVRSAIKRQSPRPNTSSPLAPPAGASDRITVVKIDTPSPDAKDNLDRQLKAFPPKLPATNKSSVVAKPR